MPKTSEDRLSFKDEKTYLNSTGKKQEPQSSRSIWSTGMNPKYPEPESASFSGGPYRNILGSFFARKVKNEEN